MKKKIPAFLFALLSCSAFAIIISSCNNNKVNEEEKEKEPKDIAEEHNEAKFNKDKEKDAQFLVDASEINLTEIRLSELAKTKAMAKDVKDLAKMMLDAHTKLQKDLEDLATKKMITIPTTLSDDSEGKKLEEKTGKDFDDAYCEAMVNGHKDAITKFDKASTDAVDSDIRGWAASTLPALRTHLDHAMACNDKRKGKDVTGGKVTTTKDAGSTTAVIHKEKKHKTMNENKAVETTK